MRLALLLFLILAPLAAPLAQDASASDLFAIRKNFGLFADIYEALASEYVDPVDAERLMRTGIASMTDNLDPYTVFFDEATTAAGRLTQAGDVGGTGVIVQEVGGQLVVVSVLDATSGETQGVRPGDAVVSVGGRSSEGLGSQAAANILEGEPGSTVELVVTREGEPAPLRFVLVRAEPPSDDVSYAGFVRPGVGYVRLTQFFGPASAQIREAVEQLQSEGELTALLLDLRGNPGGLLEEAVRTMSMFVPSGTTVATTNGRAPGMAHTYTTDRSPLLPDLPVAVLVDNESASASEIVAGAFQDLDRGLVVGETSFGKGLVQIVRPMPYGTALKLTVSRYATPTGREIQRLDYHQGERAEAVADDQRKTFRTTTGRTVRDGGGIEPDVPVSLGIESELEKALVRTAAFLRFANRFAADNRTLPENFRADAALLADFRRFVEREGVDYQTDAERALTTLASAMQTAGYEGASGERTALERAIAREKAEDFERHATRLTVRLRQEILARYVDQENQTAAALADDPVVQAAIDQVTDARAYARLLGR
ncbi:MAG: S41 family peptidase [Bacteroidota bacterium]